MTKSSSSSLYFVSIDTKRLILKNTCLDNNIRDSKDLNIRSAEGGSRKIHKCPHHNRDCLFFTILLLLHT